MKREAGKAGSAGGGGRVKQGAPHHASRLTPHASHILLVAVAALVVVTAVVVAMSLVRRPDAALKTNLPTEQEARQRETNLRADRMEKVVQGSKALIARGRLPEAIQLMHNYVSVYSDDLHVRAMLGAAYAQNTQFDLAEQVGDQLLMADKAHRMGHWLKGLALWREKAPGYLEHWDQAAKDPSDADVLIKVGCGFVAAGEMDRAEGCLDRGLKALPTRQDGLTARADVYAAKGQYPKALELLDGLLAGQKDNPLLYERRGHARDLSGDQAGAAADYEKAWLLSQTGNSAAALAEIHARLAAETDDHAVRVAHYRQSAQWGQRAAGFKATAAEGNYLAARAHYILGGAEDDRMAAEHIAEAARLSPNDVRVLDLKTKIAETIRSGGGPASQSTGGADFRMAPVTVTSRPAGTATTQPNLRFGLQP